MPTFRNTVCSIFIGRWVWRMTGVEKCWGNLYGEMFGSKTFLNPSHSPYPPAYEDGTVCSETSAYKIQTRGNYPEESIQQEFLIYSTRRSHETRVRAKLSVVLRQRRTSEALEEALRRLKRGWYWCETGVWIIRIPQPHNWASRGSRRLWTEEAMGTNVYGRQCIVLITKQTTCIQSKHLCCVKVLCA